MCFTCCSGMSLVVPHNHVGKVVVLLKSRFGILRYTFRFFVAAHSGAARVIRDGDIKQ